LRESEIYYTQAGTGEGQLALTQATNLANVYHNICQKAASNGEMDSAEQACRQAVDHAARLENAALQNQICQNAGPAAELVDTVKPACARATDLAVATQDAALNFDVCESGQPEGLEETVEPACAKAVELATTTDDASISLAICRRGLETGRSELVEPACRQAVDLAGDREDAAAFNLDLCRTAGSEALEALLSVTCDTVVELAREISVGEPQTVAEATTHDVWAFSGKRDQIVTIRVETDSFIDTYVGLLGRDGQVLHTPDGGSSESDYSRIGDFRLPKNDTYLIDVGGITGSPSSYTLSVTELPRQPIRPGLPISGTLEENTLYTFTGKAGQIFRIAMNETDGLLDPNVTVRRPDWTSLYTDEDSGPGSNALIYGVMLPEDGPYTIIPGSYSSSSGAYTLTLTETTVATLSSATAPVECELADSVVWSFEGEAGDIIKLTMSTAVDSQVEPLLTVLGPDGVALSGSDSSALLEDYVLNNLILSATGVYTVIPSGYEGSGAYTLKLTEAITTEIKDDNPIMAESKNGLGGAFIFEGSVGQLVTITMEASSGGIDSYLTLVGPDGQILKTDDDSGKDYDARIERFPLPANGSFIILTSILSGSGPYSLTLTKVTE
jgi:hypothetical protein